MNYIPLSQRKGKSSPYAGNDPVGQAMASITNIESGGNYEAVGPETDSGDRAYGRYQIMGANIPEWSKEALGRSITVDEFLANPQIQDQITRHQMTKSYEKYGNLDDVASVWFTGRPVAQAGLEVKDVLGTSNADYLAKFREGLGQSLAMDTSLRYIPLAQRKSM